MPQRAGPGRTPTQYMYTIRGVSYTHTAFEWTHLLGLKDRNTFYNRLKSHKADPRGHPLTWVFRHAPDAPIATLKHGDRLAIKPYSPTDAAAVRAIVESELGDLMGEFE